MFSRKSQKYGQESQPQTQFDIVQRMEQLEKAKPFFPSLTKLLLIVGLGILSWLATYTGMLELIAANAGYIDFSYRLAIAFAVAMLMLMIIYLLDALFSPISWWVRILYISGYAFLTLISVGFGFGFYWKFLESRSEATRSAESAVTQVQTSLQGGQTRLEQLLTTLTNLTALSAQKAEIERAKGGTCGGSPPGDGPRRRLRDADAKSFEFSSGFVRQRAQSVNKDIAALNKDMAKLLSADKSTIDPKTGTRNLFLRELSRKLDLTIARFNAFRTDPQLQQYRDNFSKRAGQTSFDNGRGGTFKCPDPQLQTALRGVVKAIDGLPDLDKPAISAVEGSEAIVEAFARLTVSAVGALTFHLPPTPEELRALQQKAVRSVQNNKPRPVIEARAGLGERDYIPLFIAIFVDFCILLVSINRPVNRMQKLLSTLREVRETRVHDVLNNFQRVHQEGLSYNLDIFHDVMFDTTAGDHFVAVPLDVSGFDTKDPEYRKSVIQARYLSTLMAALEEGGLVTRKPTFSNSGIHKKLEAINSKFKNAKAFRLYKFKKGAWSALVLDDVMGNAAKIPPSSAFENIFAEPELPGFAPQRQTTYGQHNTAPTQQPSSTGPAAYDNYAGPDNRSYRHSEPPFTGSRDSVTSYFRDASASPDKPANHSQNYSAPRSPGHGHSHRAQNGFNGSNGHFEQMDPFFEDDIKLNENNGYYRTHKPVEHYQDPPTGRNGHQNGHQSSHKNGHGKSGNGHLNGNGHTSHNGSQNGFSDASGPANGALNGARNNTASHKPDFFMAGSVDPSHYDMHHHISPYTVHSKDEKAREAHEDDKDLAPQNDQTQNGYENIEDAAPHELSYAPLEDDMATGDIEASNQDTNYDDEIIYDLSDEDAIELVEVEPQQAKNRRDNSVEAIPAEKIEILDQRESDEFEMDDMALEEKKHWDDSLANGHLDDDFLSTQSNTLNANQIKYKSIAEKFSPITSHENGKLKN